jgi:hypothetical protein
MSDELRKLQQERIKQLFDLGLKFNGDSFIYKDDDIYINFHYTDLLSFNEERWDTEYGKAVEVLKPKQL